VPSGTWTGQRLQRCRRISAERWERTRRLPRTCESALNAEIIQTKAARVAAAAVDAIDAAAGAVALIAAAVTACAGGRKPAASRHADASTALGHASRTVRVGQASHARARRVAILGAALTALPNRRSVRRHIAVAGIRRALVAVVLVVRVDQNRFGAARRADDGSAIARLVAGRRRGRIGDEATLIAETRGLLTDRSGARTIRVGLARSRRAAVEYGRVDGRRASIARAAAGASTRSGSAARASNACAARAALRARGATATGRRSAVTAARRSIAPRTRGLERFARAAQDEQRTKQMRSEGREAAHLVERSAPMILTSPIRGSNYRRSIWPR